MISGASIAGPVLAHGLVRRGFEVVLVERAPGLRRGGHAIDIHGKAAVLVERMGLMAAVRAARTQIETLSCVLDPSGRTVDVDIGPLMRSPRHRHVEIVRDDLVRILFDAVKDDVEVVFGDSVREITDRGAAVDVSFERGAPRSFDLVVGADGQHSTTRALVFGPEAALSHHLGAALAIYTIENATGLRDRAIMYNTPGRAAAIPAAPDFYFDEMSQIRMERWSRGRVVLLGDAAHGPSPLSGQGTTLAIVGAAALAEALDLRDPGAALARWDRALRPYVKDNQAIAQMGKRLLIPDSRPAIWLRNQMLRLLPLFARLGLGFPGQLERASG